MDNNFNNYDNGIENNKENSITEVTNIKPINSNDIGNIDIKPSKEKKKMSKKKKIIIIVSIILVILLIGGGIASYFLIFNKNKNKSKTIEKKAPEYKSEYRMNDNSLSKFDLYFLQLENEQKNKIYSPLSIKYALAMLSEGANGDSKKQIDSLIGDYNPKKYTNSDEMSLANALFIRDTFKDNVKENYSNGIMDKYNAEVIYDSFMNANVMNGWISDKTFKLINNLLTDDVVTQSNFILANALGINMKWNNQIHCATGSDVPCIEYSEYYNHEKIDDNDILAYSKTSGMYTDENEFPVIDFNGKSDIKTSEVLASFNRYNIVQELGESKIREEVGNAYKEWLKDEENVRYGGVETDVNKYLDKYINELNSNYGKANYSTDFYLYDDENVKSFAKDLQSSNGTTLQYVGIMPKNISLDNYIKDIDVNNVNSIISNLKDMKIENFKDGVVTLIDGNIPFFKYEYELDLMNDLKSLGIKDVFDSKKADLSKLLNNSKESYIGDVSHKANIEFTNDGIKAAAATVSSGFGSTGGGFEYLYKVPVERIDITFDKPYMYLIRDKDTGEIWFTGTVYEPEVNNSVVGLTDARKAMQEYLNNHQNGVSAEELKNAFAGKYSDVIISKAIYSSKVDFYDETKKAADEYLKSHPNAYNEEFTNYLIGRGFYQYYINKIAEDLNLETNPAEVEKIIKDHMSDTLGNSKKRILELFETPDMQGKYSEKTIEKAIENLKIDFKEEALKTAKVELKSYKDKDRESVYKRLCEEDLFTSEEAKYAVDKLNLK